MKPLKTRFGNTARRTCCKCGSDRVANYTTSAYRTDILRHYNQFWYSYPRVDSSICIFHLQEFGLDS